MKISLQSKFQPNRTSGYRDIAIFFKIWPKFGPSSGTLGPIPKKFLRCNLPYCAGSVLKFQPPSFKTVAVVWQGRTFLASPLYIRKKARDFPGFNSISRDCLCFPGISHVIPGFQMLFRDFPGLPGIAHALQRFPMPSGDFPCFSVISHSFQRCPMLSQNCSSFWRN